MSGSKDLLSRHNILCQTFRALAAYNNFLQSPSHALTARHNFFTPKPPKSHQSITTFRLPLSTKKTDGKIITRPFKNF
jgi:hypothetical protein